MQVVKEKQLLKPKALVFFDLDGTLLNNDSEIDADSIEALERLKENGAVPFIATGRSHIQVDHVLEKTVIDSFISLNGQYIQCEGEDIYKGIFDQGVLNRIKRKVDETNISVSFYSTEAFKVTERDPIMVRAYDFIHTQIPDVDPDYYKEKDILMALLFTENKDIDQEFIDSFPELSFYRNSPFSIDTILKVNSKAVGIDRVLKAKNWYDVPVYAFGDGPNDIEMLKRADYSIAMENGIDEIKSIADVVVKSNIEGGIAEGLAHFGLI